MPSDRWPVVFTVGELWLLRELIRHEVPQMDTWHMPPADLDLNDDIARALAACADCNLNEYTLLLSQHQLLVLDYNVKLDHKMLSPRACGMEILLKVCQARTGLTVGIGKDLSYAEVPHGACYDSGKDSDNDSDSIDNP